MSDLYKEAIAEARKLRELAEADAKNKIIEHISPLIKEMISKEMSESSIYEEDDMNADFSPAGLGDVSTAAPIQSVETAAASMPLPDEDGKIVLDIDQLFVNSPEGDTVEPLNLGSVAPAAPVGSAVNDEVPPPISAVSTGLDANTDAQPIDQTAVDTSMSSPASSADAAFATPEGPVEEEEPGETLTENLNYNSFEKNLSELAFKIFESHKVSEIVRESLKTRLFSLLETLDKLAENEVITPKQMKLNEKKLEKLFIHLKEAKNENSYNQEKGKDDMKTSLKEFAANLFESEDERSLERDSVNSGDTGVAVHGDATEHAEDVSGVDVDDLFKEEAHTVEVVAAAGSVDAEALPGLEGHEMPLEDGEPMKEELEVEGHAGFGDAEEKPVASPDMFFEVDEADLKEAIAALRKEGAEKGWEDGEPEGGHDASKKVLKKESVEAAPAKPVAGKPAPAKAAPGKEDPLAEDLVVTLELPDEVEDELEEDDVEISLDLVGDDEESEEDSEVEMGSPEMGADSEEEDVLLKDDEDGSEDEDLVAMVRESRKLRAALAEARKAAAYNKAVAVKALKESRSLKKEMAETNLFLSKMLYLNKFLQLESLTRKQKQQIVEHLDKAKTIAEAKETYRKIKNKLNEAATKVTGTTSKPVTSGAATLNESSNGYAAGSDAEIGTVERWQKLANIKK